MKNPANNHVRLVAFSCALIVGVLLWPMLSVPAESKTMPLRPEHAPCRLLLPAIGVQGPTAVAGTATLPTPTPRVIPTPSPTYVPGGTIFFGPLRITRVVYVGTQPNQFDEFVEIENIGGAQMSLSGIKLRYLFNGCPPAGAPGPFQFPNGEVILANQKCHIYTNGKPLGEPCAQDWKYSRGNLWPDTPGRGITVQIFDLDNREMARFTY